MKQRAYFLNNFLLEFVVKSRQYFTSARVTQKLLRLSNAIGWRIITY